MKNIEFKEKLFDSVNALLDVRQVDSVIYVTPDVNFDKTYMSLFYDAVCYFFYNQIEPKKWVMTEEFLDELIDYMKEITNIDFSKEEKENCYFFGLPIEICG